VPVRATFLAESSYDQRAPLVHGVVHGVRRVPGGTAVYYSLGVAEGDRFINSGLMPVLGLAQPYGAGDAFAVRAVDPQGGHVYLPMIGSSGCLCSTFTDWGSKAGALVVGWAVLPPLPASVTSVELQVGFGAASAVPVEEGALEPTSDAVPLYVGAGWPVLPTAQEIATVRTPARFVKPLVRHSADPQRKVTTSVGGGTVREDLSADVLFATDSATLTPAARSTLQEVAARVRDRAKGTVTVVGHTDSTGTSSHNQTLSEARARAVRDALRPLVGRVPLVASGRGEQEPVADDATPDGRQANRRVTVTYAVDGS
jgi:outer membrane protein OmpA-like peptidoglycan-associated protein